MDKVIGTNGVYEKKRLSYHIAFPLMWILTLWVMAKKAIYKCLGVNVSVNSFWFDGMGKTMRAVKEGAASWRALDIIYNRQLVNTNGRLGRMVDIFWLDIRNAQAVRNRLVLVRQELSKAIDGFADRGEVRILSLAAGSAQGVVEVLSEYKRRGQNVQALLVDLDETALEYARELAERSAVADRVQIKRDTVAKVKRLARAWQPQIIEMIGLLDYLPDERAVKLLQKIGESLPPGGIFLTANIRSNGERHFLKWVINWPMLYRSREQLAAIVASANFSRCRIVYEPFGIHGLAVAVKDIGHGPG